MGQGGSAQKRGIEKRTRLVKPKKRKRQKKGKCGTNVTKKGQGESLDKRDHEKPGMLERKRCKTGT